MKNIALCATVVVSSLFAMSSAQAAPKEGFYAGGKIGYSNLSAAWSNDTSNDISNGGVGGGVFGGYQFNHLVAVEGGFDYLGKVSDNYSGVYQGYAYTEHDQLESSLLHATAKLGFDVTPELYLYGRAGLGLMFNKASADVNVPGYGYGSYDSSGRAPAFVAGIGAEYALSNNLGLRLDYQYTYAEQDVDDTDDNIVINNHLVTAGLVYHF